MIVGLVGLVEVELEWVECIGRGWLMCRSVSYMGGRWVAREVYLLDLALLYLLFTMHDSINSSIYTLITNQLSIIHISYSCYWRPLHLQAVHQLPASINQPTQTLLIPCHSSLWIPLKLTGLNLGIRWGLNIKLYIFISCFPIKIHLPLSNSPSLITFINQLN
jgi:hypothetical protein